MLNSDDAAKELKEYFKKLLNVINNNVSWKLFGTYVVDKNKIDDILCCIEASWPKEYKEFVRLKDAKKLKCPGLYKSLFLAIKNKWFFSSNCYAVRYNEAEIIIRGIIANIDSDFRRINNMS